jgi:hypothetical protein
MRDEDP